MEYYDIVNENDEVVGVIPSNEKVSSNQLRFINIMIFNKENKLLVPIRSKNRKIFPGCYDFSVGGHVNTKESYEEAAYRELQEELGIKNVQLKKIAYFNPFHTESFTFQTLYRLIYDEKIENYDKDGIDSLQYMKIEEVKELVKKHPEKFKGDYIVVLKYLEQNHII